MKWFKYAKEFVNEDEDFQESLKDSVSNIVGKDNLVKIFNKHWKYIMMLVVLAIFYISNGYTVEKLIRKRNALEKEVKELRFESVHAAADLMFIRKQSEVLKRVNELGLDLEESKEPPIKLVWD